MYFHSHSSLVQSYHIGDAVWPHFAARVADVLIAVLMVNVFAAARAVNEYIAGRAYGIIGIRVDIRDTGNTRGAQHEDIST